MNRQLAVSSGSSKRTHFANTYARPWALFRVSVRVLATKMGLSKEQVEKHIASVEKRLGSAQERAHHGYEFARLCVEVEKYPEAIRYLTDYLSVQERDYRGHKLMGQVCEKDGKVDKAVVHYNRSLQLKPDQREVATSVAKLYCQMENPPVQALKTCLERIKPFSSAHSLVLALNEKLFSIEGGGDSEMVTRLAEKQLALCKDDIATHIRLVNHYNTSGVEEKALSHCLSQRKKKSFMENRDWLNCTLQIAEQRYVSLKKASTPDYVAQCQILTIVLDHLSLLFHTSGASGSLMVTVLLKYDKVLYAALQALGSQQPHMLPVHRVALRELCGQFYLLMACYMYWGHRFRTSLGGKQILKHSHVGDLCLMASLSFPPPNLDSIPLSKGIEERQELEAWRTRACQRLCVVIRQLILVSKQKGDIYLGGLPKIAVGQGGKLAIIKAVFTGNEDLRGVEVKFAATSILYNIRSSYLAAESEHLLAQGTGLHLPSENEAQLCDRVYFLNSGSDLSPILWLCLCLRAIESSSPVFSWLSDLFPGLKVNVMSSNVRTTAIDTLCLCDVEGMLVLSINALQSSLTSPPSHSSSLSDCLLHHLPVTIASLLDGADMVRYRRWWSCIHQWFSASSFSVHGTDVKQTICEGLGHVRGCRPLRLSVVQLTSLAKHFQERAETLVEARDSVEGKQDDSTDMVEALLKRSSHYWEILVDILADRDSYRETPKYRKPQSQTPKQENEGASVKILLTPKESDKVTLLNEARMALADSAAYKNDFTQALGLYSRVKTAKAAWNQAQIHVILAQQSSPDKSSKISDHLEKAAETLEIALSRLNKSDKELREKIEEKQVEVKQLLSEKQRRIDIAISLHYDSSPDSSPPITHKSSTPTATGTRERQLSPFSLEKKSPTQLLNESLRVEIREKNSLIVSMSDQLKSLQAEVSALKLHISPTAPRHPHPHSSFYGLHQASPQAMGGTTPHQYLSPGGVPMYYTHPSHVNSFGSPLMHQQSPMRMGMPVQQPQTYYASPQPHLTPLPPHLSPSTHPALSIPSTQLFRGHPQQSGIGRPQQLLSGTDLRPGMFSQQVAPSNIPPATMLHTSNVGPSEGPLVVPYMGVSEQHQHYEQMQMRQQQQQQMQLAQQFHGQFPGMEMLEHQQRIQQQQQQQQQQLRMPQLRPSAPSVPITSSPRPTLPDPGFVLKPGTFLTDASQPQKSTQDAVAFPMSSMSGHGPPSSVSQPPLFTSDKTPNVPTVLTTSGAQKEGEDQSTVSAPSLFGVSVSQSPFTSTLPLSSGFQFSMKPSPDLLPVSLDGKTPLSSSTPPKVSETLTSVSPISALATTKVSSSLGTSITTSLSSTTSLSLTTAAPLLSFYATATTTSSMAAVQPSSLYSGQQGASIFGAATLDDVTKVSESETQPDKDPSYDAYPDFKPIVSLPRLDDISTGEEDETVLFSHRAKLYRFDSNGNTWKERGIGDMKILEHKESGKARVLMRREQVLKLCCNHYITEEMSLTQLQGDKQVAWFTHCDFAEGVAQPEKFAVKFKQAAVTAEFQNVFKACIAKIKGRDSANEELSSTPLSFKEMFAAPVGSWECATCLVQNLPTATKCLSCSSDKPRSKGDTTDQASSIAPSTSKSLAAMFSAPVSSWECDSCLVRNMSSTDKCIACGTSRPGASNKPPSTEDVPPIRFGLPTASSVSSTAPFKFGSSGGGEFKLDTLSFGTPASFTASSTSGGFKMAGLDLSKLSRPGSESEKVSTEQSDDKKTSATEPFLSVGANSLFGTKSSSSTAAMTSSGGFNFSFGATEGSSQTKTESTSEKPKTSFNFLAATQPTTSTTTTATTTTAIGSGMFGTQLGTSTTTAIGSSMFSVQSTTTLGSSIFSTQPTTTSTTSLSSGIFSTQPQMGETGGGFKFSLPSPTPATSEGSTGQSEGVLQLEPLTIDLKDGKTELDFASIFKASAPATSNSNDVKPFQFGVPSLDAPTFSPVPPETEEHNETQKNTSAHEPDIHFEPIVTLPDKVEIRSGEENEEAVFAERAKLFRFDTELNQWKERGVGELKILVNRSAGKARVLMRRDQVFKICCNHFITREMSLSPMQGNTKAWTWFTLCDFADETEKPEKLAARFKSPAIANAFKKAFEDAVECGGEDISTSQNTGKATIPREQLTSDERNDDHDEEREDYESEENEGDTVGKGTLKSTPIFFPSEDTWDCTSCYVINQNTATECSACGKPRCDESHVTSLQTSQPFSTLSTTETPQTQRPIQFGVRLQITPRFSSPVVAKDESPEREIDSQCSYSHTPSPVDIHPTHFQIESRTAQVQDDDDDDDEVIIVAVDLPSEDKIKLAEVYMLPPSFFNYEKQPPCPGCRGCVDLLTGHYEHTSSRSNQVKQSSVNEEENREIVKTEENKSDLKPFSGSQSDFSFSSLAASANAGGVSDVLWGQNNSGFSGFKGAGAQLFVSKPQSIEEDENPDAEVDVNFRPIVTLEAVATKTGEEEEECLFSHRAKLYRFDVDQWKERGVGDIKILKNTTTQRSRVVMRRDQIMKICCNHLITPEMSLEQNIASEKSRTWKTFSDFAEEIAKEEIFSVRFKHVETAKQFEEVFKSCQVVPSDSPDSDPKPHPGPKSPPSSPPSEKQRDNIDSKVSDKASSLTCSTLKDMLASSETDKDRDDEILPPTGAATEPAVNSPPSKESPNTTPQLRLPLTPPSHLGPGTVLSVGSALRLPLTQPQQPSSESESPIPEKENLNTVEDENENPPSSQTEHTASVSMFGSGIEVPSFADLAKNTSASGFGQNVEGLKFSGVGQKVFSPDAAEDPENETDTHFKPIVTLPEVANVVKSWDDDADVLFCRRCKLYRFDDQGQWKERGVGELKIMKHHVTRKVKLIMCRDQILKICCNHSLTPDMKVTPMETNDKACTWFTSADYSEEEVRPEKLSAKFKSVQIVNEFMEIFDRCKAELVSSVEGDEGAEGSGESVGENESQENREGSEGKKGSEEHGQTERAE